ncbi:hypothetical protein [Microvirga sp. M2]
MVQGLIDVVRQINRSLLLRGGKFRFKKRALALFMAGMTAAEGGLDGL